LDQLYILIIELVNFWRRETGDTPRVIANGQTLKKTELAAGLSNRFTMKKQKNKTTKTDSGQTVFETPTNQNVQAAFIKEMGRQKDNGANSYLSKFLLVIEHVTKAYGSFSIQEVLLYSRPFELPAKHVMDLFSKWSEAMLRYGKLTKIEGAYEYPVFIQIG
jgi:hypothetical protein